MEASSDWEPHALVGEVPLELEEAFVEWARRNGVDAPKLQYPAYGADGVRGIIAGEDIAPGEDLIRVHHRLVISYPMCLLDGAIGRVFKEQSDLFEPDQDAVLAVFLVYHRNCAAKPEEDFWFPYVRTLPDIDVLSDWSGEQLKALQDPFLAAEAVERAQQYADMSLTLVHRLTSVYPHLFPADKLTREWVTWGYKTVAARGFGRRVPYVCMVPFADCFNHANVSSMYAYDYASGSLGVRGSAVNAAVAASAATSPAKDSSSSATAASGSGSEGAGEGEGEEVRPCLAAFDVEDPWLEAEAAAKAKHDAETGATTEAARKELGSGFFRMYLTAETAFRAGQQVFISYGRRDNRHLAMEYGFVLLDNEHETVRLQPGSAHDYGQVAIPPHTARVLLLTGTASLQPCELRHGAWCSDIMTLFRIMALDERELAQWAPGAAPGRSLAAAAAAAAVAISGSLAGTSLGGSSGATGKALKFATFTRPLNLRNEVAALEMLIAYYHSVLKGFGSSVQEDEDMLAHKPPYGWRLQVALQYRITRKRIVQNQLELSRHILNMLRASKSAKQDAGAASPASAGGAGGAASSSSLGSRTASTDSNSSVSSKGSGTGSGSGSSGSGGRSAAAAAVQTYLHRGTINVEDVVARGSGAAVADMAIALSTALQ